MSRISHPLDPGAVKKADDAFYKQHPEKVIAGQRQPINADAEPELASQWRNHYIEAADPDSVYEKPSAEDEPSQQCQAGDDPQVEKYLHVFVLVPGTTRPVNNLFDFITSSDGDHSAGSSYWYSQFLPYIHELKKQADTQNEGDKQYQSELYLDFSWGGENNFTERVKTGQNLANKLWQKFNGKWGCKPVYFHLIGHSHGGNVINNLTNALSASNKALKFGDQWFIKSITYLSTPFFQKIEQPASDRIHSTALILNSRNYYDLTQRFVADFTVKQVTQQTLDQLTEKVIAIKGALSRVIADVDPILLKVTEVKNKALNALKQEAKDYITFKNNTTNANSAAIEYQASLKALVTLVAEFKDDIDTLANSIDNILLQFKAFLQMPDSSIPANLREEMLAFISSLQTLTEYCRANSQQLIDSIREFQISLFIETTFLIFDRLLQSIAGLLENDKIYQIIALYGVNILQFFDDTSQNNKHYDQLSGFNHVLEDVDERDQYDNKEDYRTLKNKLAPNEDILHQQFSRTPAAFNSTKWLSFDDTKKALIPIFQLIIAQIIGAYTEVYSQFSQSVSAKLEKIDKWNKRADKWLPGYTAVPLDMVSINASINIIDEFINDLVEQNLELFEGKNPLDDTIPGTIPYLAVNSHSVSREMLSDKTLGDIVAVVTKS